MELPKNKVQPTAQTLVANIPTNPVVKTNKSRKLLIITAGVFLALILLILMVLIIQSNASKAPSPTIDSQNDVSKAKKENQRKSSSNEEKSLPANRVQQAYSDVVGTESYKKSLSLDAATGIATVDYTIPSSDGIVIIKTSYENFADLAVKIFNINGVKRLNVSTYAAKFTDQYGSPNQVALKMQLTKETNDKINWPLRKFSYKDYATILDVHELNSALSKDYTALVKASSN